MKKLRGLAHEITAQERCVHWSSGLSGQWMDEEEPGLYYGTATSSSFTELGKKHVSRQQLCLPDMMEFCVNSPASHEFVIH